MKGDGGRGRHEAINVQMASVGTVRMRVTLGQRGRKDYALLNAERMVYISFAISVFKYFFFVCVINAFKKCFCECIFSYLFAFFQNFWGFLVWCWFLECRVSWSLEAPSDDDLL